MAPSTPQAFGRRGIRQRVVLVVVIGSVALAASLLWTFRGLSRSVTGQVQSDHTQLAVTLAAHVERLLDDELENLSAVALEGDIASDTVETQRRLKDAYRRSRLLSDVFIIGFGDPALALAEPDADALNPGTVAYARRVGEAGRPVVTRAPAGQSTLLIVPVRSRSGAIVAVVGGQLAAEQRSLVALLTAAAPAQGTVALEDRDGTALVSAGPGDGSAAGGWLTSAAAVGDLGLRVVVRQPAGEALASLDRVRWTGLLGIPLLFGVAVLLAWGAARSVVAPLEQLTRSAEAIAGGDFEGPVPAGGGDEAGRLARALEDMRESLRQRERDRIRGELLKRAIAAQEDERKRVARELHDETSQTVNALIMDLDAAAAQYPSEYTRARLDDALRLSRRLLDGIHRLIVDLRPSMLDDLGLASAIEWFARTHLEPLGIVVRTEVSDPERRLPRDTELALFRVAQETITNIERHAGAEHVLIQCGGDEGHFVIEIEDDGQGFDLAAVRPSRDSLRGLGLAGMHERIALIGGRLLLDSAPGEGTRVLIEAPVAAPAVVVV